MKMKYAFGVAVVVLFAISGCDKQNTENELSLNFKALFENQPLVLKSTYTDASGKKWKIEDLNFYLSELKLIKQGGEEIALADIGYVDFANAASTTLKFKDVSLGSYTGIKFNVGLTAAQNDVPPNLLDESDVRNEGLYWGWLKYVFVRLGGRADVDNTDNFNTLLVYHVGADDLLRIATINKSFEVKAGSTGKDILLNVDKIFTTAPTIDITIYEESYSHSEVKNDKNYPTAIKFADNFVKAFTLN